MNITTLSERLRTSKSSPSSPWSAPKTPCRSAAPYKKAASPSPKSLSARPPAIDAIRRLRDALPDILIGAGTVLNAAQAKAAQQAGADFIVSPGFNPNTVKACQDLGIAITPASTTRPPSKPHSNTASQPSNTSRQKPAAASKCSKRCSRPMPCCK